MKKLLPTLPSRLLPASLLLLLACTRQEPTPTDYYLAYADYRPLFMTRAVLEGSVAALPAQALHHPGKIYLSGDYLFINERYEGIHIVDNRDPAHPQPVSFLRIPGNVDLATQGTVLYADNGPDLVAIDISDPAHAHQLSRTRNAFRELPMPVAGVLEDACQPINRPTDALVVGWRKLAPGEAAPVKIYNYRSSGGVFYSTTAVLNSAAPAALGESGKAGSTARFCILNQTLYTVDEQSLRSFSLQSPTAPTAGPVVQLGFGIETIFPHDHYLFLGSQTGMFIYDATTAASLRYTGGISHVYSCDPVVVDGNFAYVTLRSTAEGSNGSASITRNIFTCGGSTQTNELDVVDISNPAQPRQVRIYPMSGPLGLGAENGRLYVCDDGLKVFDTTKAPALTQVQQLSARLTDVIPNGDYLLAVGPGGLYQYAVSGPAMRQVSVLPIMAD
ncbi:MAG: LVIVD repeat-containing protein [Janthinobacterium lividum]